MAHDLRGPRGNPRFLPPRDARRDLSRLDCRMAGRRDRRSFDCRGRGLHRGAVAARVSWIGRYLRLLLFRGGRRVRNLLCRGTYPHPRRPSRGRTRRRARDRDPRRQQCARSGRRSRGGQADRGGPRGACGGARGIPNAPMRRVPHPGPPLRGRAGGSLGPASPDHRPARARRGPPRAPARGRAFPQRGALRNRASSRSLRASLRGRRGDHVSIVRARLKAYSLPLRDPWPSSDGDVTERRGWILALEDDLGRVGLGDAAPFPGFGLETHTSAGAGLRLAMARLVGTTREGYAAAINDLTVLAPVAATSTARSAIDCALHDLIAQAAELPLARYLGGAATLRVVPANATVPRVPPERAAEMGLRAVASGIRTIKVKVGGVSARGDEARLSALRDAVGPEIRIRVDANEAWSSDQAIETLRALARFDLEYAE